MDLMATAGEDLWQTVHARTVLGLHHEQQHQELLLTDIKHIFASQPLRPAYISTTLDASSAPSALAWLEFEGGIQEIGHDGRSFCYDNEMPRHRAYLDDYRLASRLVTNGEYLEFMTSDGYRRPEYWLSDGWRTVKERQWGAPLYWECIDGDWWHMTLGGMRRVDYGIPGWR